MTPEEAEELVKAKMDQLRKLTAAAIKDSIDLIEESTLAAVWATTARTSGNWDEYWQDVSADLQSRINDQYDKARDAAGHGGSSQPNEPDGSKRDESGSSGEREVRQPRRHE